MVPSTVLGVHAGRGRDARLHLTPSSRRGPPQRAVAHVVGGRGRGAEVTLQGGARRAHRRRLLDRLREVGGDDGDVLSVDDAQAQQPALAGHAGLRRSTIDHPGASGPSGQRDGGQHAAEVLEAEDVGGLALDEVDALEAAGVVEPHLGGVGSATVASQRDLRPHATREHLQHLLIGLEGGADLVTVGSAPSRACVIVASIS